MHHAEQLQVEKNPKSVAKYWIVVDYFRPIKGDGLASVWDGPALQNNILVRSYRSRPGNNLHFRQNCTATATAKRDLLPAGFCFQGHHTN